MGRNLMEEENISLGEVKQSQKMCPFLSKTDQLIPCLKERCAIWFINECSIIRMVKKQTSL
jgi:hypothetical protein